jgi:ribosomal protein S18 acetylase RimI-like enzyme
MPAVTLLPLSEAERAAFIDEDVADYAEQQVRDAGWPPAEALDRARERLLRLLRQEHAAATAAGHPQWTALGPDGQSVGWLWVQPAAPGAPPEGRFLYQITVKAACRRQGYGRAMLAALERLLTAEGVSELRLNVWDANQPARRLYEQAGYELAQQFGGKRQLRKALAPLASP